MHSLPHSKQTKKLTNTSLKAHFSKIFKCSCCFRLVRLPVKQIKGKNKNILFTQSRPPYNEQGMLF